MNKELDVTAVGISFLFSIQHILWIYNGETFPDSQISLNIYFTKKIVTQLSIVLIV